MEILDTTIANVARYIVCGLSASDRQRMGDHELPAANAIILPMSG